MVLLAAEDVIDDLLAVGRVHLSDVDAAVDQSILVLAQGRLKGRSTVRGLRIVMHTGEERGHGGFHRGAGCGFVGA